MTLFRCDGSFSNKQETVYNRKLADERFDGQNNCGGLVLIS